MCRSLNGCKMCGAVDLMRTKEIMCRAYDAHQNTQPQKLSWNLMGMMNNCVYRIKVF